MRDNRKRAPLLNGGSSLMTVFAVLCLTVFAVLALATVWANGRLSAGTSAAVLEYYAADCQAEEVLALLRSGTLPESVRQSNGKYCYAVPISDSQRLEVEVVVNGTEYTVLRWQAVSAVDWQADDSIVLWNGEYE